MPDGSFSLNPASYNPWKPSGFFQITMGFGELSFGMAKFIDIAFDIVVGRGGQVLLALVSCRVFVEYITSQMEVTPISFATYKIIFLREGPTFWSTIRLLREFVRYRALNSKVAMTWMILSASFIVAFPTLASAMSGYSGNSIAFVPDQSTNDYLLWSDFQQVDYIVHDGERVNLVQNFVVAKTRESCYGYRAEQDAAYNKSICYTRLALSDYAQNYGLFGLNKTSSIFNNITLPSPVLNISAFYLEDRRYYDYSTMPIVYGHTWEDPRSGKQPFSDPANLTYLSKNSGEIFKKQYIDENGVCQPTVTYKWGFSFLILFVCLVCLIVWTIGTYILWLKAHLALRAKGDTGVAGEYKAIIELSEAMTISLRSYREKPETLHEKQIRKIIRKDLSGGTMMYHAPLRTEPYSFWAGFKRWGKRDKWWILALAINALVLSLAAGYYQFGLAVFSAFPFSGMVLARWIGQTWRSRTLIIVFHLFLGVIIAPITFPRES
ncbi:hypothetical protein EJ08DRAFT_627574 [Tothia fuscella]|uniref:Uncharacterized protein n=1 Tax=Tothia fuscella TaxID=1048955 RepID=A0A9P4NZS2_9PEZI|nr:hypothetical protein EJ08DRAFT_627574 [Tothia fuscella]